MTLPLKDIRVLDFTSVLAGPYCTYQLAMMGAEVVKIETPGTGDIARHVGADTDLSRQALGASFLAQNAGKDSVELDLKTDRGRTTALELAQECDVVMSNFRPGVMERLGLGWDDVKAVNPKAIYCLLSGFGQQGPLRSRQAYDQIIQGMSGIMSVTGTPEVSPLRVGFPVCDTGSGMTAAFAICAALVGRAKTGEGCCLDISMLESAVSAMAWTVSNYTIGGKTPGPMGNENPTNAPSGAFPTKDGLVNLAINSQAHYETLCRVLERADLIDNPLFVSLDARKEHRDALNKELHAVFATKTSAEWESLLSGEGVPCARILSLPETVELEQLALRGFFTEIPLPDNEGRTVKVSGNGILIDGEPVRPRPRVAKLGEDTARVLGRLASTHEGQVTPDRGSASQKE